MLNCGLHTCPHRCHQLQDHSKMKCTAIVKTKCPQNHKTSHKCHDKTAVTCRRCEAEARTKEKRQRRDHELDQARQAKQRAYAIQLAEIDDEIEHEKRMMKDKADETDRRNTLMQKKQDLVNLKAAMRKPQQGSSTPKLNILSPQTAVPSEASPVSTARGQSSEPPSADSHAEADASTGASTIIEEVSLGWDQSEAKADWEWQKQYEGADNEALDSLMAMIGRRGY
jgi:hypothetical protein